MPDVSQDSADGGLSALAVEPPASLPEHVRGLIEQAILEERLAPGQRVTEAELAETFSVSRTPVREAMHFLEAQGLVVRRRGRGTHIAARTTAEEADVIYRLRLPLESYLAGLAAERLSQKELGTLDRLVASFRETLADFPPDRRALVTTDSDFHRTIYRAAQSDLISIVNSYWSRFLRELSEQVYRGERLEGFADQHEQIAAALRVRDPDAARERMSLHIRASQDAFMRDGSP